MDDGKKTRGKHGAFPRERHHNWKGGKVSVNAGRGRAERWFPDCPPCERCGNDDSERHHVDGNTANNDVYNIRFLCRRCHMIEDGRLAAFILVAKRPGPRGVPSVFTKDDVERMRSMVASGQTQEEVGRVFGIAQTSVSRLLHGKRRLSNGAAS